MLGETEGVTEASTAVSLVLGEGSVVDETEVSKVLGVTSES